MQPQEPGPLIHVSHPAILSTQNQKPVKGQPVPKRQRDPCVYRAQRLLPLVSGIVILLLEISGRFCRPQANCSQAVRWQTLLLPLLPSPARTGTIFNQLALGFPDHIGESWETSRGLASYSQERVKMYRTRICHPLSTQHLTVTTQLCTGEGERDHPLLWPVTSSPTTPVHMSTQSHFVFLAGV